MGTVKAAQSEASTVTTAKPAAVGFTHLSEASSLPRQIRSKATHETVATMPKPVIQGYTEARLSKFRRTMSSARTKAQINRTLAANE